MKYVLIQILLNYFILNNFDIFLYLINVKTVMLKNKQNRAPIDDKKIETRRIFGCSEQYLGNTSSKNVSNTRPTGFQAVSSQVDILPQRNACLTELLKCQTRTIHKDVEKSDAMTSASFRK